MSLDVELRTLPGSSLVQRYLAGDREVRDLFSGDPFDREGYRARLGELAERFPRERRACIAAALRPASEAARQRLDRFVAEGGAVVTTGQQAGFLGGPLYTVYKALTAVRLAADLEAELGVTVLPVFWIASEDHDWAEVNHAHLFDTHDRLRRVELASDDPRPLSMGQRRLAVGLDTVLDEVREAIAHGEHADHVLKWIQDAYRPGATVADSFSRLVATLFAPFDMLLLDAADPVLKRESLPVLAKEIARPAEHERALRATADRMEAMGFVPQVTVLPSAANLFLDTAHGRERLYRDARGWLTHETGERYSADDLQRLLFETPGRFSPNVLLRPVVESNALPVLAYVAGPGEIAYFAQLRGFFEVHGVPMPRVYPRASLVLVEPRIRAALQRLGLTADDLRTPRHELLRRHARDSVPAEIQHALGDLRRHLVDGFDRLSRSAARIDPTLEGAVGARRNRALLEVAAAEQKLLRAVGAGDTAWTRDLDTVSTHLVPLGSEQERVLSVVAYLSSQGPGLLERVAEAVRLPWT